MGDNIRRSSLHREYNRNRIHNNPILTDDNKTISMKKEEQLGIIDLKSYLNYNEYEYPGIETITSTTFPAQDYSHIGYTFALWYLDEFTHMKMRGKFTVIRWDMDEPYRVILVNDNLKLLIVSKPEHVLDDGTGQTDSYGRPISNAHVHHIPIQNKSLIGVPTRDEYFKDRYRNEGNIIRADEGGDDPQVVILEEINEDTFRVVTLAETKASIILHDIIEPHKNSDVFWPTDWRNLK